MLVKYSPPGVPVFVQVGGLLIGGGEMFEKQRHNTNDPRFPGQTRSWLPWMLGYLLLIVSFTTTAAPKSLTLIYSGNLDGELEPCGCAEEGDLGGLKRQATTVDRLRSQKPDLFLVSSGGLLSSMQAHERLTSEFILTGIKAIGYDALGVQWTDLGYGASFIGGRDLPWVASNWIGEEFAPVARIQKGGVRLAVFSWLDPDNSPHTDVRAGTSPAHTQPDKLLAALRDAKAQGRVTLLTTTLPRDVVAPRFNLADVDIVLVKSAYEKFGEPMFADSTLFLQPGSRGMRLGRADIKLDVRGKITSFQHEVISMPTSVPDAPRMQAWYDAYNTAVKEAYLRSVAIRKATESGERDYVGAERCQSCHTAAAAVWANTSHAHAYDTLERVGKGFDPYCIGCHTVGFKDDGGFIDKEVTAHLTHVQCENCHGQGRAHVASGGKEPLGHSGWEKAAMCGQCHIQKHSPGFELDRYWPKIAH